MKPGILLSLFILLSLLVSTTAFATAAEKEQHPPTAQHRLSFEEMGAGYPLTLSGAGSSMSLSFGVRGDELITSARVRLTYTYSPSLLPHLSHIKVLLNDEVLATLPMPRPQAGRPVTREIPLDPRFLADFNNLRFEMIGHYKEECEDPLHSSIWARISNHSKLLLEVQQVRQATDLTHFPEPFFDPRDLGRLDLPFIFAAGTSHETLAAAAELASWFGIKAAWRGARFPALINQSPERYGVVFAINGQAPEFLGELQPVNAPAIKVVDHPQNPWGRLLLLQGRHETDLRNAVHALTLGKATLAGKAVEVTDAVLLKKRQPYDAPNWVRLDRPVKFGELVKNRQQLQVTGHQPGAINIDLRIPDDLFTWRSNGIPLNLKYRYSAPRMEDESRLTVKLNNQFLTAFNLRQSGRGGIKEGVTIPLFGELLSETNELLLPAYGMRNRNRLQFQFSFSHHKESSCTTPLVDNMNAAIDDDSTIDLTGYPHYTALPNLRFFANSGYPFTRLADQSETVAIIASQPTAEEISTLLTMAGRLGESTGYPATSLRVVPPVASAALQDKELLIIGSRAARPLLEHWNLNPATSLDKLGTISSAALTVTPQYDWFGFQTAPKPAPATRITTKAGGALAAVVAFESPVTSGRSVVAFMSNTPHNLLGLLDTLENPEAISQIHGSVAFVRGGKVASDDSTLVGQTYFVGELSLWNRIRFYFSHHPLLLIFFTLMAALVVAFTLWRMLKNAARQRMEVGENTP
ncbi:MAG TPA: cellulose biosynthesis cyclic di-GMP-binding regulatory protein BcsB [Thiolapillus brandeum]|uniref:Cyclic di-GMP-binding protein n=1 Tax=Thiolapillus brandeum TaxID=1076588 RepID=A0A831KBJ3_9GAMM|nr:cellulose biosynthesis cyclic di-GMP-binding regulatory protein BcsB [Thiolapillus brandeum]